MRNDPEFCPLCGTLPCLDQDDWSLDDVFVRVSDKTDDENDADEQAALDSSYERLQLNAMIASQSG